MSRCSPGNSANLRRKSVLLDMSNRRVSIIERVKRNGQWVWGQKWELPLNLTAKEKSRRGKFYILMVLRRPQGVHARAHTQGRKTPRTQGSPVARKNQAAASGGRGGWFAAP